MMGQKSLAPKFAAFMDIPLVFMVKTKQSTVTRCRTMMPHSAIGLIFLQCLNLSLFRWDIITELQEEYGLNKSGFVSLHAYRATGD